jgi:ribosomal protein S18 acetylase RimI-like enzyme
MDKVPVDVATGGEIREASCREYDEIRRLLRAAYAGYASTVAAEVFPVYLADVLDLSADGATVLVALDGGSIVGTARLHVRPTSVDLPAGSAYVRGVAVRPDREGGGIARAHMSGCAERARAAGATSVYVHTTSFMTRAIRLYRGLGYVRAPSRTPTPASTTGWRSNRRCARSPTGWTWRRSRPQGSHVARVAP